MAYEIRDLSGSLFKNERKEKETHPDMNGTAMIDGKKYYISAWLKEGASGKPFTSMAFKLAEEAQAEIAPKQVAQDDGSDIPF